MTAIAQSFDYIRIEPQTLVYQQGQIARGLDLRKTGKVAVDCQPTDDRSHATAFKHYRHSGDWFGNVCSAKTVID